MMRQLVIFGCGFIGSRLARAALAAGRPVRVAARNVKRLAALAELGAEVVPIDAAKQRSFGPALVGTSGATVVYSVPPIPLQGAGEAVGRAAQAAGERNAARFIYFGSAGVYGRTPDPEWVDEETSIALDDPDMAAYIRDESALAAANSSGLSTIALRLSPVYGAGRGVRARLRKGDYKLIDDGQNYLSRVHVDDLVRIVFAAEERAPSGALYCVGDDRPAQQREVAELLCQKLGLPMPKSVESLAPGKTRVAQRARRIRNAKLKRELGIELLYPTYVEGEAQIDREEAGETTAAAPSAQSSPQPAPQPAPPSRPAFIQRVRSSLEKLAPGDARSWPDAQVIVVSGTPDLKVDGVLHRLGPGDAVRSPHAFVNHSATDVTLFVSEPASEIDQKS